MPPTINAFLPQQMFALGERIPLTLAVSNAGPGMISVIDPRYGGEYFRLKIMIAPGQWRVISMAEARSAPGVPVIVAQVQVPVGHTWQFDFDVSELSSLDQPGSFVLVVEYEWQPGQVFISAPIPFSVTLSPTGFLTITPTEATRSGYHSLVWVEGSRARNTVEGRALFLDFRIQKPIPPIRGATEIARVNQASGLALSMSPAGSPFPDHWLGWVNGERVYFCYWARAEQDRLAPGFFLTAGASELITPILASRAPDEGRPGCLMGLLFQSAESHYMTAAEIKPDGQYQVLSPQPLNGVVKQGWATAPNDTLRLFVFACQTNRTVDIVSVSYLAGEGSQRPRSWFNTDGEFLAGDVRVMPDHTVRLGILLKRGEHWERLTLDAPDGIGHPEPSIDPLMPGPQATATRVRLDGKGDLHTLFLRDGALHYAPPKASAESSSYERPVVAGDSPDLLIGPVGRPVLVYYDFERGPVFQRI